MGLDMYLKGEVYHSKFKGWTDEGPVERELQTFQGYPVSRTQIDMGYWRKHPDLHGLIVREYADGKDECQAIYLDADDLRMIAAAQLDDALPTTSGFFFGQSAGYWDEEERVLATVETFLAAADWLDENEEPYSDDGDFKNVVYQASW